VGVGQHIWKAHLEYEHFCRAAEPVEQTGSQAPWSLAGSLPLGAAAGAWEGGSRAAPPDRPEVPGWGGGAPHDSRGGRNAAVGTAPGSRTPLPPSPGCSGLAGGASSREVALEGSPRARCLDRAQRPPSSAASPGPSRPLPGRAGAAARAPDLGWEQPPGQPQPRRFPCPPPSGRATDAPPPAFHSLC
jgi:hypothetical protein